VGEDAAVFLASRHLGALSAEARLPNEADALLLVQLEVPSEPREHRESFRVYLEPAAAARLWPDDERRRRRVCSRRRRRRCFQLRAPFGERERAPCRHRTLHLGGLELEEALQTAFARPTRPHVLPGVLRAALSLLPLAPEQLALPRGAPLLDEPRLALRVARVDEPGDRIERQNSVTCNSVTCDSVTRIKNGRV
jgi:hypothetical protein|tara:strand:- start:40 stop:624 length:585 start_codon:yes stop_codon:yes gene_type:complete